MVTREEVERIAGLARLALADEELERLTQQLNDILSHMDALRTFARPAEAWTAQDPAPAPRADVPGPDPLHMPPSRIAPEWRDGFFIVPRQVAPGGEEDAG